MTDRREFRIEVPVLARVEGEGGLDLRVRDGRIAELRFRIYEPPRLFEQFLAGRHYTEVPDLVARICGICPVAYQMSAVTAVERLFGTDPGPWVRQMRRLFYCGEWLQSHALHIHLLAAPDFLGFENVLAMAAQYPEEARRGLRLQALGNRIIRLLGGRSVHPVGVQVGGFWKAPDPAAVTELRGQVERAIPACARPSRGPASRSPATTCTAASSPEQPRSCRCCSRRPTCWPVTRRRSGPLPLWSRAPAPVRARARHRAACSGTATMSATTAA